MKITRGFECIRVIETCRAIIIRVDMRYYITAWKRIVHRRENDPKSDMIINFNSFGQDPKGKPPANLDLFESIASKLQNDSDLTFIHDSENSEISRLKNLPAETTE